MAEELRDEDARLAQRLGSVRRRGQEPHVTVGLTVSNSVELTGSALASAYDPKPAGREALEQALMTASAVTICGVAPRSLVEAMQNVAKEASLVEETLPWHRITYITPKSHLIFATRGTARLGSVVQKWQSALNGIRNCVRQIKQDTEERTGSSHSVELSLLASGELFLDVGVLIEQQDGGRSSLWVSVGPSLPRAEALYLVFDDGTEFFDRISATIEDLQRLCEPIVSRQLAIMSDGLEKATQDCHVGELPTLEVSSLVPVGTKSSCMPTAITVLRSAAAGKPVVLLYRRSRFNDTDDFDKLSLLSSRILEEDLAGALGVPIFTDRSGDAALDAMWLAAKRNHVLRLPLDAFIKAAQRDIFISCGLDVAAHRFVHLGCHFVRKDQPGQFVFFAVFDLVLSRNQVDELTLALKWNQEQLVQVNQDEIYSAANKPLLNRLLLTREEWLQETIFSTLVELVED